MRFRDYFRDKVKDLCVSIVNSLTSSDEFSENEKEREIAIIENQKKRYANKEFYNNNNLREVIPVLETADKELKKDNRDSIHKDAKSAIKKLKKHLKVIDAKREDFLSALENIVNDDENKKSYILYKDEASRNIVLYNYLNEAANLVATEKGTIGDSIVKPAVITIDLDTNYVSEYKTVNEMFEKTINMQAVFRQKRVCIFIMLTLSVTTFLRVAQNL